jgi:hypothetical protein
MLAHAHYPDLWPHDGYPPMPTSAAIFGQVVHTAIETIMRALVAAGCESTFTADAVQVLRQLDGITNVAERALNGLLTRLQDNPRIDSELMRRFRAELITRLPTARVEIQAYLSRLNLQGTCRNERSPGTTQTQPGALRWPLGDGVHLETILIARSLRLTGRVDLLTINDDSIRITDFKTGSADPGHLEQLRMYALLWYSDRDANPGRHAATELNAAYPAGDVAIPAPTPEELRILEQAVESRISAADAEVASEIPRAIPSDENCKHCQVRQLCSEYWEREVEDPAVGSSGALFDYEGIVGPQNGARSWWMLHKRTRKRDLLIRTISASVALTPGTRIRVLGLRLDDDAEVDGVVAAMTAASEVFELVYSI